MDTNEHPNPAIQRAHEHLERLSHGLQVDLLACDRCGGNMMVRGTQVDEDPCHNDIRIKCRDCFWWTRHGVPIDREEYEMEMDERDHSYVDAYTSAPESARDERLEALGYIER